MSNLKQLLQFVIEQSASDLHLIAGTPPTIRVHGKLSAVPEETACLADWIQQTLKETLTQQQFEQVKEQKEFDFSLQFSQEARFRCNVYQQQGSFAMAFRHIPNSIKSIDELQLPQVMHEISRLKQGLVLITGPTGEGKSTTLAAIIDEINQTRTEHIITIEDPIEFVYKPSKSIISQREVYHDTLHWSNALKSVLREDPDVVLIGELRDLETIATALTIAETGHLVLSTLHTNSASQTVDRIIDVFPENQQQQIRQQLASTLSAVFSQRLVPARQQGRVAAVEIMMANLAVRNLIREGKSYQIDNVIQTSLEQGMISMESSLGNWVKSGAVVTDVARSYAFRPSEFDRLMKGS